MPRSSEPTVPSPHFTARLIVGVVALNLIVVMLFALTLYESRAQREEQAVVTAQNLSRLLEHDLDASFDKIDLTLLAVVDEVSRLRSSGSLDASVLNAFIARQAARLPELSNLRMADAQGNLRYGTGLRPDTLANIADREFFIRLRDHPDAGLVVSKAVVSRTRGKWQIVLMRRLNQPDGSFAGTVAAVIELDKITAKFAALDIGRHGVIVLLDHELAVAARYPAIANGKQPIGQKITSRQFEEQLRIAPEAGVFHASSPIDHRERISSYRKIPGYPFCILVGLSAGDYLGEWWKDVAKNGVLMAIFALVTLWFSWRMVGSWKRREADLKLIQQQEQKFRTLLESSPDPLVIADAQGLITLVNRQVVTLFGYEPEELVGQPVEMLLPQRYHGGHVALRQGYIGAPRVREMGKDRLLWAVTKQGREVPVNVSLSPIHTEQGLMVAASIRDVSERRANEAKIKRLTELYAALSQCSQAIVRCTSEDELFPQICRAAVEFGGMKMAWIGLLDEASQRVKPVAWYGTGTDYLEGIQISVNADEPSGRGMVGMAIRDNRSEWIQDFQNDPRLAPWHERGARAGWRAAAAMPLLRQGKVIGALSLYVGEVNAFDEAVRNLLVEMARDIGQALNYYRLQADRQQAEEALRESEARFRSLSGMSSDFYWESDVEHRLTQRTETQREAFELVFRQAPSVGLRRWEIPSLSPDEAGWQAHRALLDAHLPFRDFVIVRPRANGAVHHISTSGDPVFDTAGHFKGYRGVGTDITERRQMEEQVRQLAFHDTLTQLPNRRLLNDRLTQAMAASKRSVCYGALMFLDLDNFKPLNDLHGHAVGDVLLREVADRLKSCVRETDTVARFGGDEFVVLLSNLNADQAESTSQAQSVAEKIRVALSEPYRLTLKHEGQADSTVEHRSTPSIGVTLFSGHQTSIEELLKQADLAMYQAKAAGRNTLRFFDPEMQAIVTNRAALEADLREAVKQQQFILYYQAQVAGDGRLTGAEALVRWQHPQRGLVSPADFIPLAEETNLILPLGHWVLDTACAQLATWAAQPDTAHLSLAVNVSAHQLHQADFVDQVLAVLGSTGANPHRLKLELTESVLLSNVEKTIVKMIALKAHGVGFSLDDFGTGYSSLSYLKRLPLEQLKIDRGFVKDILIDPNDAAISKMVIALAESMGLPVIAEGVETEAQRDYLARLGCHAYQGYLFSRPLPLAEFEAFVKRV